MTSNEKVYICIGAQRSATTWIYRTLSKQSGVVLPKTKEIDFFRYLGNYSNGLDWYENQFNNANMWLDITPEYAVAGETVRLIAENLADNAEILLVIRDPIERMVSAYQKHLRNGDLQCDFEFFVKYNIDHCVDRSLYFPTIKRFSQYYKPTVLVYEDIKVDPDRWLEGVNKFFNVSVDLQESKSKFNPSSSIGGVRGLMNKFYRLAPGWLKLRELKEKIEGMPWSNKLLYGGTKKEDSLYEVVRRNSELTRLFAEDKAALEKYLERDLSRVWGS
ncbi:sulfotransferase domain-containing protein [Spongiibacter sp. KMU-166]|uniref:Sulfotransferase domain-containing protein n=1 Tax=Spongiibacter thalassae TaxID=2721624 RepID=A0ABX1GML3_9GAMM|nr:sulfotransferase domain-containing protein [Spongiibacter thalassae]NKI19557.1 sulfotransferase domain-containing protein [Spongiibacter thalassae]